MQFEIEMFCNDLHHKTECIIDMKLNQDRQDVEGVEEDQHEQPVLW